MDMIEKAPICFTPYLKSVIWGGDKICLYKGIIQPEPKIGESWEISAVKGHESVVSKGKYKGMTISELADTFGPELLGNWVYEKYGGKFPLLIKFIDAADNLSVQVHPDDSLAMKRHNCLGKTEMWYIIDADNNAKIYAGLNQAITPDEYVALVDNGTFENVLAKHDSTSGDVFFLPAGRVHAIGKGNLLVEIQESSDITYRIFDYNRHDANGNTRELHTQLAKDAIDYTVSDKYKSEPVPDDIIDYEIVNCNHFNVRRINVNSPMTLNFNLESFTVVICTKGLVELQYSEHVMKLKQGQTVLCPAVLQSLHVKGRATLIVSQISIA